MNGKSQRLHIDCSNDIQQRRRVSGDGSSNLSCEHGTETGLKSTEDLDQSAIAATRLAFRYRQKVTFSELMAIPPDGQVKFPHPWPPQIPPGRTAGL